MAEIKSQAEMERLRREANTPLSQPLRPPPKAPPLIAPDQLKQARGMGSAPRTPFQELFMPMPRMGPQAQGGMVSSPANEVRKGVGKFISEFFMPGPGEVVAAAVPIKGLLGYPMVKGKIDDLVPEMTRRAEHFFSGLRRRAKPEEIAEIQKAGPEELFNELFEDYLGKNTPYVREGKVFEGLQSKGLEDLYENWPRDIEEISSSGKLAAFLDSLGYDKQMAEALSADEIAELVRKHGTRYPTTGLTQLDDAPLNFDDWGGVPYTNQGERKYLHSGQFDEMWNIVVSRIEQMQKDLLK